MSIKDIEEMRAANAAAITATNEAEAALVNELQRLTDLATALASALMAARLLAQGVRVAGWHHRNYWTYRKDINPTLNHFGFVITEHPELRDVGIVVRAK